MNKVKKIPKQYLIFLLIAFLMMIPGFINHGIHGDDATFHITNIMAMNQNSSFFNLPTRIRPLIASNFGYGSGIFYPELIHIAILYLWKILNIFHIPLSLSIILFMILFITLTAIFMYNLLLKLTKQSFYSTVGSIFYITFPYFISDIYRRSAYGELIVFLALPLIVLGIYYLLYEENKMKFYTYFILGYYLIFSSHLISVIYTTLFISIFLLFHLKPIFKNKNFIHIILASTVILSLSLNYIVPIFEHKFATNYMVFEPGHMYTRKSVIMRVLSFKNLLLPRGWLTSYIPIVLIGLILFCFIKIKKIKEIIPSRVIYGIMSIFFVSCFLILSRSIWQILPNFLLTIQFPWRNCAYLGFSASILATFGLLFIPTKYKKITIITSILLLFANVIFIFMNPNYIIPKNNTFSYRDGGMGWQREYLTKNAYQNLDYFFNRDNSIKIINSSNATIKNIKNNTPNLSFTIIEDKKTIVEIPRFYYLWYSITLTDLNNKQQKIKFYENEKGFIEFKIPKSGKVDIKYQKTFISKCSEIISTISMGGFIIFISFSAIKNYKKSNLHS